MWEKGRATIYSMAGIYLLFMAYNIFHNLEQSVGKEYVLMITAVVLFIVVGIGLQIFSFRMLIQSNKREVEKRKIK